VGLGVPSATGIKPTPMIDTISVATFVVKDLSKGALFVVLKVKVASGIDVVVFSWVRPLDHTLWIGGTVVHILNLPRWCWCLVVIGIGIR